MSEYYQPKPKDLKRLEHYLDHIYDAAQFYLTHLSGKKVFFITKKEEIIVDFTKNNLLHLMGLKYSIGPNKFFEDLENECLNCEKFLLSRLTFSKLQSMYEFPNLFTGNSRLFNELSLLSISMPKGIRTNKKIVALGIDTKNGEFYFPRSLIDIKNKEVGIGDEVLIIYTVDDTTHVKRFLKSQNSMFVKC